MAALLFHLQHVSHRDLRGMATRLSLRSPGSNKKEAWVEALHQFLLTPQTAASLSPLFSLSAWHSISRLLAAGEVPAPLFFAEYGPIRRPGINRSFDPPPWQSPQSVTEELYYTGLLHSSDGRAIDRCRTLTIPFDLRPLLRQQATQQEMRTSAPFPLLHDLAQVLLYLHADRDVRLLHGRWLAPSHLARLNQRLLLPEEVPLPASHKRCRRLAFLFFLAEAACLLSSGTVTAFAWVWLAEPPAQQITLLWQAWLGAEPALAQRYDQPGAYLPLPWPHLLIKQLTSLTDFFSPASLAGATLADSPAYEGFFLAWMESLSDLDQLLADTLYHPLRYLSLVTTGERTPSGENAPLDPNAQFQLTPVGRWLLQPTRFPPLPELEQWPSQPAAHLIPQADPVNEWLISIPVTAAPTPLLFLAAYARYLTLDRSLPLPLHRLRLDLTSVAQASSQGHELFPLLRALADLGVVLTVDEKDTLANWHQSGRLLRLQILPLLRVSRSTEMQDILAHRLARQSIGELLTPTLALLAEEPAAALGRLAGAGFFAQSFLPSLPEPAHTQPDTITGQIDGGTLWLMGQVYALLAKHIPLPDPPYRNLALLFAHLPAIQQATLQAELARIQTYLEDLLDGLVFAPPPHPSDPQTWLPLIEQAIEAESDLQMTYFTSGRNLLTQRRVQPHWVTTTDNVPQLTAYCHSAGEMRTFNLDRIQSMLLATDS